MKSFLSLLSERREMGDFRKSHLGLGENRTQVLLHWSRVCYRVRHSTSTSKINLSFNILVLCTLLIHIVISVLFWIHRQKEKKIVQAPQQSFSVQSFIIAKMKKESLFRYHFEPHLVS